MFTCFQSEKKCKNIFFKIVNMGFVKNRVDNGLF